MVLPPGRAMALLPARCAAIKLAARLHEYDALRRRHRESHVARRLRGAGFRRARRRLGLRGAAGQNTTDMKWGVFLAVCAGIEVSALRKCRERAIDVACGVPPLPAGPLKRRACCDGI